MYYERKEGGEEACIQLINDNFDDVTFSGEHSSELRPDTLLASDGCGALGLASLLVVTMPVFIVLFSGNEM